MTDLRYALRQLIKSPSFSMTAMFAVIYAFLLRPLPYAEPEKLVMLQSRSTRSGNDLFGVSGNDLVSYSVACFLLASTAAVAALIPARRASLVNPMEALRAE